MKKRRWKQGIKRNEIIFPTLFLACFSRSGDWALKRILRIHRRFGKEDGKDRSPVRIDHFCEEKRYCVDVEDTGIGIDAKELPHLFKPYYQAGLSGSRPGVGLGLAIVKKLVDFLNGTIEVKSQSGKGSTFTVSFPYDLPQT